MDAIKKKVGEASKAAEAAVKNSMSQKKDDLPGNVVDEKLDKLSGSMYEAWDDFCDKLEASDNETLQWISLHFLRRLSVEAPVVVTFVFLCTLMHLISFILPHGSIFLGVDDFFDATNPMHYIRQFTHIFMHDGLPHLRNNMTHMLLVGPSSEAVFGSVNLIYIIIIVAISSAWAHILMGGYHTRQLGASGVCFAVILLNSLVSAKRGKIPVSFVLTVVWWLGDELIDMLFAGDNVSHHAHLVGGIVGAAAGYYLRTKSEQDPTTETAGISIFSNLKLLGGNKKKD